MSNMDQLLQSMLSFPPYPLPPVPVSDSFYDSGMKEQVAYLRKVPNKTLAQKTSSGEELLDIINPALNTVPYAYILLAFIDVRKNRSEENFLWQKLDHFTQSFDARQIRYIGNEFSRIIEYVVSLARSASSSGAAVPLISRALLRLDPEGTMFTSHHLMLLNLALETRNFTGVQAVISRPVLFFPGKLTPSKIPFLCNLGLPNHAYITQNLGLTKAIKTSEILEYFMCSGCVFLACRQWEKAVEAFEDAICYPCKDNATSKIMVDAYKKWILASLLWKGKVGKLPVTISAHTIKSFHALARPYETVAELFMEATAIRLRAEADAGADLWKGDQNTCFMREVLQAYQKHQIRALANIYTTVSISEVTVKTFSGMTGNNLPNDTATERLVRDMIAEGSLNASVRQNPGGPTTLNFEPVQVLSESEMAEKLEAAVRSIQAVTKDLKHTDHKITQDKEYLKWLTKQRKNGHKGPLNAMNPYLEEGDSKWGGSADLMDEEDLFTA